jgi:16S rRNA (guanine1516-N2)-methyltransferase
MPLTSIIKSELEKLQVANSNINSNYEYQLDNEGISVHCRLGQDCINFRHSFSDPQFSKRLLQPNQSLLKACNNKQRSIQTVLDLTGGWGMDSFMIAHNGREVTMLEQSRLVYAITAHSLKCAEGMPKLAQAAQRINILNTNCTDYLANPENSARFDCIYIDPMFPSHKSSAKPSKEMQILQQLTSNMDIELAFELALRQAKHRVVMKRPAKSPPFSDVQPDLVYREKTVRFDVYLTS